MMQRQRLRDFLAIGLGCGLLALLLLWPVVQHPDWWLWTPRSQYSDLAVTHWPNAFFTRRSLWQEGRFPVWRATIMSGAPFAANPLSGLGYLPNWFLLFNPLIPLEIGFNVSAFVHVWCAGVAMAVLMRDGFKTGAWGAAVAAVVYEVSPKLIAHLGAGHVGWSQAWAWLPVVVLCWLRGRDAEPSRARRWAAAGGASLGLLACADVRMAAYCMLAVAAVAVIWCAEAPPGTSMLRQLGRFAVFSTGALCVCLGVSACQWLPMVALLPDTTRAAMTLADVTVHSLPWTYLLGLFLADHGGFHEWIVYVGVSTLVLVWMGLRGAWDRRWVRWLPVLLVGVMWFSLGENGGLFALLWRVIPGLGLLRVPPRAWVLVVFGSAVLAGFGIERQRPLGRWERRVLFGAALLPAFLSVGYNFLMAKPPLNLVMLGIVAPLAVAGAVAKLYTNIRVKRWIAPALVALVVADLLVVDRGLIEARSPGTVFADGQEAAAWLAAQPGEFRVYSPSYSIPQHVAERYGLQMADGVDPLQLRVYADYLTRAAGLVPHGYSVTLPPFPEGDVRTVLRHVVPDQTRLRQLGVRYIAAAFPVGDAAEQLAGIFGGVYVYDIGSVAGEPVRDDDTYLVLQDGTVLYWYDSRWVSLGWLITILTIPFALAIFGEKRKSVDN